MAEPVRGRVEGALGGEGADVELVQDRVLERDARRGGALRGEGLEVDDGRQSVGSVRQPPAARVGQWIGVPVQEEAAVPGGGLRGPPAVPVRIACHVVRRVVEPQRDPARQRRPHLELHGRSPRLSAVSSMLIVPIIPGVAGEFWTLRPRRADNHPVTSSFELPAFPAPRLSDAERDRALGQLREGAALGKLSHDTFLRRMELALVARRSEDLAVLTADLQTREAAESPWTRRLFGWVGRVSALRIGRDPVNGLRLSHETVSRMHAELSLRDGVWVLKDLGSTNGTSVNGHRVTGSAVVRDGDQVSFGNMSFRLSAG